MPDDTAPPNRCRCGYDRQHHMVSPKRKYTAWGTFWHVFMGVSANPISIEFQCRVCGQSFDRIDDPASLKSYL